MLLKIFEGKTISDIKIVDKERIVWFFTDGTVVLQYHEQDCCECVRLEDIDTDIMKLIGATVISMDESTNHASDEDTDISNTWTFYRLSTTFGGATIRWYGSSNGWYSERVDTIDVTGRNWEDID